MPIKKRSQPPTRAHQSAFASYCGLLALSMVLLALLSATFYQTPHAYAASASPIIHWDGAMIYPGQNNGNPEGPVGEVAVVHGENFTATAGQPLKLILVAGDSNNDATLCQASNSLANVGSVTPSSSGTFDANFDWPSAAGQVSKTYSICSLTASDGTAASSRDDGPFTVLSASKPTLTISAGSVVAGGSIIVSGKNWVPPQPLNIDIAGCADCDPGNSTIATTTTSSAGSNTGTFSITVPIPPTAAPGNYVVNVFSQNGPLDAFHLSGVGAQHLAVTAPPVAATPTITPSPSPTVIASPTVAPTPTTTAQTSGTTNTSGSNTGLLIGVLVVIIVLLLAIASLVFYMLGQRNKQGPPPSQPSGRPETRQFPQYATSGGPQTPFPSNPGQSMSQGGQFNNASQNGHAGDYHPQSWSGNQPSFAPQNCVRCGSPLTPNSAICGRCGLHNTAASDPDGPTITY